jgi:hypothetical protein
LKLLTKASQSLLLVIDEPLLNYGPFLGYMKRVANDCEGAIELKSSQRCPPIAKIRYSQLLRGRGKKVRNKRAQEQGSLSFTSFFHLDASFHRFYRAIVGYLVGLWGSDMTDQPRLFFC